MSHRLIKKLTAAWPAARWQDVTVLLAVSGGADSMALLRAVLAAKTGGLGRVEVAHFNHRLRGPDSDEDQRFVAAQCQRLGVEAHFGVAGEPGTATEGSAGESLEGRLRETRYQFLGHTAQRIGARYLATAHTADDQAETILHRILRGTGLAGLAGIRPVRAVADGLALVRPLLAVSRAEVLDYLDKLGQPYREDATNQDRRFTRNRIRHDLLPRLAAEYNPVVRDALLRLGRLAAEAQAVIDVQVATLAEQSISLAPEGAVIVDCRRLADKPAYLVRELMIHVWRRFGWPQQAMGYEEWNELAAMASGPADVNRTMPGEISAQRDGDLLRLSSASPAG